MPSSLRGPAPECPACGHPGVEVDKEDPNCADYGDYWRTFYCAFDGCRVFCYAERALP